MTNYSFSNYFICYYVCSGSVPLGVKRENKRKFVVIEIGREISCAQCGMYSIDIQLLHFYNYLVSPIINVS